MGSIPIEQTRNLFERANCEPNQLIMIGDRLDNDIFPAKTIGMKPIRIMQDSGINQHPLNDFHIPDYTFNKLSNLLDIL